VVGSNQVSAAGINGVNFTSLAIAPDGTPYVAYEDGGNSYKATVMRFSGDTWSTLGIPGFSGAGVNYTSLAIGPTGAPTLAYTDGNNNWQTTVMKYSALQPTISGIPPATTIVGMLYSFIPATVSDSVDEYYISGSIPPGLQFDNSNGSLFGIPETPGSYDNIVIGLTVSSGATAFLPPFSITVNPPAPTITGTPLSSFMAGNFYSFTPISTSATGFSVVNLPPWAGFDPKIGVLSGTPGMTDVGTYPSITITANNVTGSDILKNFSIMVFRVPCRIVDNPQNYSTLQEALNSAVSIAEIQAVGIIIDENLTMATAARVTLSGGWDPTFTIQNGYSVLQRPLVIIRGKLVVNHMIIRKDD
jgi:hypothetical protein